MNVNGFVFSEREVVVKHSEVPYVPLNPRPCAVSDDEAWGVCERLSATSEHKPASPCAFSGQTLGMPSPRTEEIADKCGEPQLAEPCLGQRTPSATAVSFVSLHFVSYLKNIVHIPMPQQSRRMMPQMINKIIASFLFIAFGLDYFGYVHSEVEVDKTDGGVDF